MITPIIIESNKKNMKGWYKSWISSCKIRQIAKDFCDNSYKMNRIVTFTKKKRWEVRFNC
jgi:hypothetical protein